MAAMAMGMRALGSRCGVEGRFVSVTGAMGRHGAEKWAHGRWRALCSREQAPGVGNTHAGGMRDEADGVGGLPTPDLNKLAALAKVSLTEEQIRDYQPKVNRVVEWFAQLQELDLDDSEIEDSEVIDCAERMALREDVPREYSPRDALIDQAPEMEGPFFKLPRSASQEDT